VLEWEIAVSVVRMFWLNLASGFYDLTTVALESIALKATRLADGVTTWGRS
jgi:hypothetical protein